MPVNRTVLCLQFGSVCHMGLTDSEHTALREISGSRREGKTGEYGKFHIDEPRRGNQTKNSVENVKTIVVSFEA